MNKEIATLIGQIARIRNVDTTYVCETLKLSVIAGLKRRYGPDVRAEVDVNPELGDLKVYLTKTVISEVKNDAMEVSLYEAARIQPDVKPGDEVRVEIPPGEIGRIAIRKASEELMLKLREAERTKLYDEYLKKRGEIVTGTIQKIGRDEILVNLGLVEGSLGAQEQLKTDHYRQGAPLKCLIFRVEKTAFGPRILLSRTHPDFLRRLLAREIPEIRQGTVEIRGVARAPSFRSKVAVHSLDARVDPVGACVGYRKSRIENVIKELSGEKIDIVPWNKDPILFVTGALGPARVKQVIQEGDTFVVVVPDSEFSIAIGKKGQNVWLASLLIGSKLEVLKESDFENRAVMNRATRVSVVDLELGPELTTKLQDHQVLTAFDLLSVPVLDLAGATGLDPAQIVSIKRKVSERFKPTEEEEPTEATRREATRREEKAEPAPEESAETKEARKPAARKVKAKTKKTEPPPEAAEPSSEVPEPTSTGTAEPVAEATRREAPQSADSAPADAEVQEFKSSGVQLLNSPTLKLPNSPPESGETGDAPPAGPDDAAPEDKENRDATVFAAKTGGVPIFPEESA